MDQCHQCEAMSYDKGREIITGFASKDGRRLSTSSLAMLEGGSFHEMVVKVAMVYMTSCKFFGVGW